MELGHSGEIPTQHETTEHGFSEKRSARIIEGKMQDNSQVKKRKAISLPKQIGLARAARVQKPLLERLVNAHKKNAEALNVVVESLMFAQNSIQKELLLTHMRSLYALQGELLNAIALNTQGQQKEESLSKELRDLVK